MQSTVKAAAVQFTIALGDVDANLAQVREALARLAQRGTELVVLPEMWSSGFAYKELNRLAQRTPEIVEELERLSREYGMVIVGSLPEPHGDKVYNTAYLVDRGRLAGSYRKLHLFSLMGEDRSLDAGDRAVVAETSLGRVGMLICYDLRFPELARRLTLDGAEILVVPGEWPKPRDDHWHTLLRGRAIENQLFIVAANCCGMVGKLDFFGGSLILGPKGEILAQGGYESCELEATLEAQAMESWRASIPCLKDRRPDCY
ncbi:carbon-nitrogen hydrolase [Geomonas silvestris]|uniref:Carbon-nitrogen hydrolase n=1 Tax=Geomonas silvestris TaxID=2740184 RepID=A0A6V8MI01_9BACT|nr:carbon-nitrogen family hydrolase [Geomonas silvestris]GFO59615.1 carbon-nitrogen hydrolase [Geomonas silvestris]